MNKFVPDFPDSWIIHEWSWMIVPVTIVGPPRDKEDVTLEPWGVIWDKAQGSYVLLFIGLPLEWVWIASILENLSSSLGESLRQLVSDSSPKLSHTKAEIGVQNHALKAYGGIY